MSRRFKGRHGKVRANPTARPAEPVELNDENSYVDYTQPDRRIPKVLNVRAFVKASSAVDQERLDARQKAVAEASKNL